MKRKLYDELVKWKINKDRKPLLIQGARQVGKTYLLKEFAKNEYKQVVYLNLDAEKERFELLFKDSIKPVDIIPRLETLLGIKIDAGDTLLIFDEIQEIPRALTALKYFCEDAPEYHVAASGSLLGVALSEGTSFPVGKVDILELAPLDFEEFVFATGNERFLDTIDNLDIFSDKLEELFREYLIVGGMPEAVANFIENHDYTKVNQIQNTILLAYLNDISKHTDTTTATRIHQIWESLPAQFAKRNEKFMFNVIREGARAREYELAVQWLVDCKIVRKVNRLKTGDKLPLKAYVDPAAFKLYFLDIGLLRHLAGISNEAILNGDALFKEFNGLFAEQFVLQQMGEQYALYYWSSGASAEVDFVAEIQGNIVPIEVKSGTNVKAKSLKVFRENYQPKLSIRFSMLPLEYNQGFLNLPIFLAGMSEEYTSKYLSSRGAARR
ncbi:ATP-binding protein [Candidatus Saccharibacteria bacterium]|nr:ATP-binding protein [Candidatus Saccharibacteria bacterium]